jgi:hypothetical protein
MSNNTTKPITIHPKAVYTGSGVIEVMAGAELSQDDVSLLVNTTIAADIYNPVFLVGSGNYRQRLPYEDLEVILAVPLAARRSEISAEAVKEAEKKEREWQEMEAQRKQQAVEQATKEAAQRPKPEPAIG